MKTITELNEYKKELATIITIVELYPTHEYPMSDRIRFLITNIYKNDKNLPLASLVEMIKYFKGSKKYEDDIRTELAELLE